MKEFTLEVLVQTP